MLFATHILPQLSELFFRVQLDPLALLQRLSETLPRGLLSGGQLCFLLFNVAQLTVKDVIVLPLFVLQLGQIGLQLDLSLLSQLRLKHETALCSLIEKVGTISQPVIAELLGDALSVWTFRPLLDKVVEEAEDLEVEALKAIILVIVKLLRDRVIVALEEVLALLIRCLFIFH